MMNLVVVLSSLSLILSFNPVVVVATDDDWNLEEDVNGWIDPHSMVYDHDGLMQKRKQEKLKTDDEHCRGRQINCAAVEQKAAECNQTVEKLEKHLEELKELYLKAETVAVKEQPFFSQYLNQVLLLFIKAKTNVEKGHYETTIVLSTINYRHLFDYITFQNVSIQEVHHILSSMMTNVQWVKEEFDLDESLGNAPFFSSDVLHCLQVVALGMTIMVAALHAVTLIRRINISIGRFLFLILFFVTVASFVISIPWTWYHLYKIKVAEKMAAQMTGVPVECRSEVMSLWRKIASKFVVQTDRCQKYMENVEIDPLWEVPPTQAVAVTLTRFFLEPASYMGRAIREFMMSAFEGLPIFLWVPMFAFIVLLLVLILFCCCRYRVYTPLIRIEPVHHDGAEADRVEALRRRVHELEIINGELERERSVRDNRIMPDGSGDRRPYAGIEASIQDVPRVFLNAEKAKGDLRARNIAVKDKSKNLLIQDIPRDFQNAVEAKDDLRERIMRDGSRDRQSYAGIEASVQDIPRDFQNAEKAKDLRERNIAVEAKSKDLSTAAQKLTSNPEEKKSPSMDPLTNEVNIESSIGDVSRVFQLAEETKEDLRERNIAVKEKSKDLSTAAQKLTSNLDKTSPSTDPLTNEVNSDAKSSDFETANQHQESNNNAEAIDALHSKRELDDTWEKIDVRM